MQWFIYLGYFFFFPVYLLVVVLIIKKRYNARQIAQESENRASKLTKKLKKIKFSEDMIENDDQNECVICMM